MGKKILYRNRVIEEVPEEEVPESVKKYMEEKERQRQRDLLWSGDRTIKETYSQIYSLYSDLGETIDHSVQDRPDLFSNYAEIGIYSLIIADFYKHKSENIAEEDRLADRLYSPGWETIKVLYDLPEKVLSEIEREVNSGEESPFYGTNISIVREIGTIIRDYLPSLTPEEKESTLFPESASMEEKEDFIIQDRIAVLRVLQTSNMIRKEILEIRDKVSPQLRQKFAEYTHTTEIVLESLSRYLGNNKKEISLSEAKRRYNNSKDIISALADLLEEKDQYYRIQDKDGKIRIQELKSDIPDTALEALQDLAQIQKSSKSGQIRVSKDLLETEIISQGDSLDLITNQKIKERIKKLQKKGKLLNGTMEGLSGGEAYFKIFTIALAQTLNEQSKYYKTEERGSGVPLEIAKKYIGEGVKIEEGENWDLKELRDSTLFLQENRSYPYLLISYEDMAKKMKGTDKISGGKDSEYVRDYIESLQSKEYFLFDGKDGIIGVRFIVKLASLYLGKTGNEVGCILQLSPQFSKTIRGYSGLRADTIKLIGGGQQKNITMNLLDKLIYTRGIKGGVLKKNKEDLLSEIATAKVYKKSKKVREEDFKKAVQKAKDAKIITKYKEEKNPGGEIVSVFTFNPDYFKGTEIPEAEDQ